MDCVLAGQHPVAGVEGEPGASYPKDPTSQALLFAVLRPGRDDDDLVPVARRFLELPVHVGADTTSLVGEKLTDVDNLHLST